MVVEEGGQRMSFNVHKTFRIASRFPLRSLGTPLLSVSFFFFFKFTTMILSRALLVARCRRPILNAPRLLKRSVQSVAQTDRVSQIPLHIFIRSLTFYRKPLLDSYTPLGPSARLNVTFAYSLRPQTLPNPQSLQS